MTMERFLEELKKQGEITCEYCSIVLNVEEWMPEFDKLHPHTHFYKSNKCTTCGKVNKVRIKHDGSGHDNLFKEPTSNLESSIKFKQPVTNFEPKLFLGR